MKLYVDGNVEAEKQSAKITHTNRREYGKDDIYIGALWNNRYNFRGVIDEVCIYNRALSEKEVHSLMRITK